MRARSLLSLSMLLAWILACAEQGSDVEQTIQRKVDQRVIDALTQNGRADYWVELGVRADLEPAFSMTDWSARGWFVYETLKTTAEQSQTPLLELLEKAGVGYESYWVKNSVLVRNGDQRLMNRLAARAEVSRISSRRVFTIPEPEPEPEPAALENTIESIEWNISNVRAPEVWSAFTTGEGMVVANIDTGVDYTHAAVNSQYRGNLGGGSYDHDYNWYDPSSSCSGSDPCDNNVHGTHTMGTMVGDDGGTNQIGVAPGAKWIAAKGCESNSCSDTSLLAAGQWIVAPTDRSGNNPDPDKKPNVVNNSWGGDGGDTWYVDVVNSWIAAGIFPAFSNGNSGSSCNTSSSPSDYAQSYSSGAYDSSGAIALFSSRGPSLLSDEIKPNIAAPGSSIRSSIVGGGYASYSGTSMASPHTAAAVALMWAAAPALVGNIDETRIILDDTAVDVSNTTCGGTDNDNNVWGEGKLDVYAAVEMATGGVATGTLAGTVSDAASGSGIEGATVKVGRRTTTTGTNGAYSIEVPVDTYEVTASAPGYLSSTASGVTVVENQTTTQNFTLTDSRIDQAAFNTTYQAPACTALAGGCDSGELLDGRDRVDSGEPNQPNTLYDSCADGTYGTYHSDESVDPIVVYTADGGDLAPGKVVNVEVTLWGYRAYKSDYLDMYYTADATANPPTRVFLGTTELSSSGAHVTTTS